MLWNCGMQVTATVQVTASFDDAQSRAEEAEEAVGELVRERICGALKSAQAALRSVEVGMLCVALRVGREGRWAKRVMPSTPSFAAPSRGTRSFGRPSGGWELVAFPLNHRGGGNIRLQSPCSLCVL